MLLKLFSNVPYHSRDIQVFKICKLASNDVIHSKILIKYGEKRYLGQFVSEMFDTLP